MSSNKTSPEFLKKFRILLFDINVSARQVADRFEHQHKWGDTDARTYTFNVIAQYCLLHGYTAHHIDEDILSNKNDWRKKQNYFENLTADDFVKLVDNYTGIIRDNFFIDLLITIEHAIRIFAARMSPAIIDESISTVKDQLVKNLGLSNDYKVLLDILFKIRNTIHNGGLHSANKPSLTYKGKTFDFKEKEASQSSVENLDFLLKEVISFLVLIFELPVSKAVSYMEHP